MFVAELRGLNLGVERMEYRDDWDISNTEEQANKVPKLINIIKRQRIIINSLKKINRELATKYTEMEQTNERII